MAAGRKKGLNYMIVNKFVISNCEKIAIIFSLKACNVQSEEGRQLRKIQFEQLGYFSEMLGLKMEEMFDVVADNRVIATQ